MSDEALLEKLGYQQELNRRMNAFSNFAMAFSVICILAGGITSFHLGLASVGGASIGIGWPVSCIFSLCTALAMGQVASAFPTAGGLYHWASILGGRAAGWLTAWFNLLGLVTVLAAINVGVYNFLLGSLWPDAEPSLLRQCLVVGLLACSQGWFNHVGIRTASFLVDCSGYLIMATSFALIGCLFYFAPSHDWSRLWEFHNYSGTVWPATTNMGYLFLLGLLLPAYTITGFDASAHSAEETRGAAAAVPRAIVFAVFSSAFFGWLLLASLVLALPSVEQGVAQGDRVFFWTLQTVLPTPLPSVFFLLIGLAQYLCGLATVTSSSRMVYAFARDGGLPGSHWLRQVSTRSQVPAIAIWTVVVSSISFTVYAKVYSAITAVCTIFLYVSYVLPIALGLWAFRRSWTEMGPWDLGGWFRPIAVVSLIGCAGLLFIGFQPPNQLALVITLAALVVTGLIWFGLERHRFQGPPLTESK